MGVINEVGVTQELRLALVLGHHGMSPLHHGTCPRCKGFYAF
jgi:hypothetical protein